MSLIRCEVCNRVLGESDGTDWLKVRLGIKDNYYLYVKEYECECGHKNYASTDTLEENTKQ